MEYDTIIFTVTKTADGKYDITSNSDKGGVRNTYNKYSITADEVFDAMSEIADVFNNIYNKACMFEVA